jgi:tRNA pseudouridine55 synthase
VLDVRCSGGTYVRALADDLGRALGTLAHLAALRRTAVGAFTEAAAVTPARLEEAAVAGTLAGQLIDPAAALDGTTRALDGAEAAALAAGRPLAPTGTSGPVAAVGPDGRLVAVIEDERGRARPRVVLP